MESLTVFLHRYILQEDNTILFLGRTYRPNEILRMIIILGGYLLLRPYVLKMQAKFQERDHARDIDPSEESSHAAMAARRADEDEDDEDEDGDGWGAGIRRRQKEKAMMEMQEEEDDSDEEIAEFLE